MRQLPYPSTDKALHQLARHRTRRTLTPAGILDELGIEAAAWQVNLLHAALEPIRQAGVNFAPGCSAQTLTGGARFPSTADLRSASLGLMLAPLATTATHVIARALAVESYYSSAASLGITQERASALLNEAQGLAAGSTPTDEELDVARRAAIAEATGGPADR